MPLAYIELNCKRVVTGFGQPFGGGLNPMSLLVEDPSKFSRTPPASQSGAVEFTCTCGPQSLRRRILKNNSPSKLVLSEHASM